jgi:hypothetical protein
MSPTNYQTGRELVNATPTLIRIVDAPLPVSGQSLSRKRDWRPHEREFWGADLYRGKKYLVEPTLAQAMLLAGAGSTTGVWWALGRQQYREEILRGLLPLVPPRATKSKTPASVSDGDLFNFVRDVGIGRVLEAACAVEAAQ